MWKRHLLSGLFLAILMRAPSALASVVTIDFPNPIHASTLGQLITNLATAIRSIAIPLAVIAIVWAGFKLITGAVSGDQAKIKDAKKLLGYIVLGTAIIVSATILAQAVVNFAKNL